MKIRTITINTNKFAYSCSIKISASGFDEHLKSIFCLLLIVGSIFPAKSCQDAWKSGSWLARSQVNMADETKLLSPIRSISEVLVVQCVIKRCCGEELGPLCWPMPAAGTAVFSASHRYVEQTSQMYWFCRDSKKTVVDQIGSRPPDSDHDLFWCKYGCGASSGSNHWTSCHTGRRIQCTFGHTSHCDEETVRCCCTDQEKMTLKDNDFFKICGQLVRHCLTELFHVSNLLQMLNNCRMVSIVSWQLLM